MQNGLNEAKSSKVRPKNSAEVQHCCVVLPQKEVTESRFSRCSNYEVNGLSSMRVEKSLNCHVIHIIHSNFLLLDSLSNIPNTLSYLNARRVANGEIAPELRLICCGIGEEFSKPLMLLTKHLQFTNEPETNPPCPVLLNAVQHFLQKHQHGVHKWRKFRGRSSEILHTECINGQLGDANKLNHFQDTEESSATH
ncbi:uncharacterized protein LOC129795097 [Lutzomyia longipalpis]|uniref:uncharacterized protein LOC129795097 n=1 Tax=Lutzomyia longipalpis TaxID=7200 RepID=UPI0024835BFD|nr:uncharacterized protein LOC129795097 [Lutzomyia longipalpis]